MWSLEQEGTVLPEEKYNAEISLQLGKPYCSTQNGLHIEQEYGAPVSTVYRTLLIQKVGAGLCMETVYPGFLIGTYLETDDEDSCPPTRCLPDRLETISQATKFTKDEIRYVYRAFKTECPSGIISEATFKSIYAKFFPLGGKSKHVTYSSQYAHYVFTNLDKGHTGIITFRDFMFGMSVVMKGSLQERLRWAFS
uniref:(California timema) hypothetical protein n=1 Tax=Timema californicum TaxID=61474 RepID=A0A7R9J7X6_TIMCA|nr:unnamed protein product [Timema californicum]